MLWYKNDWREPAIIKYVSAKEKCLLGERYTWYKVTFVYNIKVLSGIFKIHPKKVVQLKYQKEQDKEIQVIMKAKVITKKWW